jgi:hypothetical protein
MTKLRVLEPGVFLILWITLVTYLHNDPILMDAYYLRCIPTYVTYLVNKIVTNLKPDINLDGVPSQLSHSRLPMGAHLSSYLLTCLSTYTTYPLQD